MAESASEHLVNHLRDVHAIELQSTRQLERSARRQDGQADDVYEPHLEQSRKHDERLTELLESQGRSASAVEDKTLRGGAIGLRQLADVAPDTPVKQAMGLFALEHLEIAAYELLAEIARASDDEDLAGVAEEILEEERAAAEQIEGTFDRAAEQLLEDSDDDDLLLAHLQDVHAIEQQSLQLLRVAIEDVCDDEELQNTYREHLEQTEAQEQLVAERIEAREAKPSAVRDLHMGVARSGLHDLAAKPPDAHVKMAMNLFCVEHLEIAAYEFLIRIAESSGDSETVEAARKILEEERQAAEAIHEGFAHTVELMLQSDGSYDSVRAAKRPEQADEDKQDDGQAEDGRDSEELSAAAQAGDA